MPPPARGLGTAAARGARRPSRGGRARPHRDPTGLADPHPGRADTTLFGPILYEARIPALVKEGTLAPYAELGLADRADRRRGRLAARAVDPVPGAHHRPLRPRLRVDTAPGVAGSAVREARVRRHLDVAGDRRARPGDRRRGAATRPRRTPGAAARCAPPRAAPPTAGGRGLATLPGRLAAELHRTAGPGRGGSWSGRPRRPGGRTTHAARHRLRVDPDRHPHRPRDRRPGDRTIGREAGCRHRHRVLGGEQPRGARADPGPVRPRARHRHHASTGHATTRPRRRSRPGLRRVCSWGCSPTRTVPTSTRCW